MATAEYHRKWYHKNKERLRESKRLSRKKFHDRMVEVIKQLKDVPCADCGKRYPYYVMDFDHTDPHQKIDDVSNMKHSETAIREEAAKCEVVCANCHRERTHRRNQYNEQ